jgi:proline iminopeptidase
VFRHFSLPGCEIRRMDFRRQLVDVRSPVMVLAGEADPITPPHLSEEIVNALAPGTGRHFLFAGCGHGPFRDNPQGVFAEIRRFIMDVMPSTDA